jgi:hypothetical protein
VDGAGDPQPASRIKVNQPATPVQINGWTLEITLRKIPKDGILCHYIKAVFLLCGEIYMPDLTADLLPRLLANRLPGLDLQEGWVHPAYNGQSILNLPPSICRWMGVPMMGSEPLSPERLSSLGESFRHVVVVLMDALSFLRFKRWMETENLPVWNHLAQDGLLTPLTSIAPSTTSAALTSLWTGSSAATHGIIGYEMWLKEYGIVINSILHAPISYQGDTGSLRRAGFNPQEFLGLPTLGTHLMHQGVQAFAFQHHSIARSGLSQMLFPDVTIYSFSTQADLWVNLRQAFENHTRERNFFWIYWGEIDHFSHLYGPDDERTFEEFVNFSTAFERLFLGRLSLAARKDGLFILLADHGQTPTRPDPFYDLRNHPSLARRLHILPTGENRLMSLFIRPGQVEAVREYIQRTWPNQFVFMEPSYAVDAGLFGPGVTHPRLGDRLGDLIVAAKGNAYLWWGNKDDHLYGRHGGLSADEIIVPFLAARL